MPRVNVLESTVPFVFERHYFGEHRQTELVDVIDDHVLTDRALLSLHKRVIDMAETVAVRRCDTKFQQLLGRTGTPYRPAFYLIPLGMVEATYEAARAWEVERADLVRAAGRVYPAAVEAMRTPLGDLYRPSDYPSAERFMAAFWVAYRFMEFGVPKVVGTIRPDIFERERRELERIGQEARAAIEQHLAATCLQLTTHLTDLLRPKANGRMPTLRGNSLDKLFTFLDTIAVRDVTGFAQLRAVTDRLRRAVDGVDVDLLRDDDALRAQTAARIDEAKAVLATLVVTDAPRGILIRDRADVA